MLGLLIDNKIVTTCTSSKHFKGREQQLKCRNYNYHIVFSISSLLFLYLSFPFAGSYYLFWFVGLNFKNYAIALCACPIYILKCIIKFCNGVDTPHHTVNIGI